MTEKTSPLHPQTRAVRSHLGKGEQSGDVVQAVHMATTFRHGPAYEPLSDYQYARDHSPNVDALERALVELEQGAYCVAFGSGVAAGAALAQVLPVGAHILFHNDTYHDFKGQAGELYERWQIKASYCDLRDLHHVEDKLAQGVDLVWFETPSNPCLDILDIEAISGMAHKHDARVLVDSTFASPALQNPLTLGADYVLQSTTKSIGGHSDVMGGAIIGRHGEDEQPLRRLRKLTGAVMAPFSAWLATRGLQTLHCRQRQQSRSAMTIATFLQDHERVERVHYPGLVDAKGHEIASCQMHAFGSIVSFEVAGGAQEAIKVASRVQLFTTATSVGGVESLLEHRPSVEGAMTQTPAGLLRASIGLEDPDDLISDLRRALSKN